MKPLRFCILLLVMVSAVSCNSRPSTPSEVFQAAVQAARNNDSRTFKEFLTKDGVRRVESEGIENQQFILRTWRDKFGEPDKTPEIRNAKEIEKDTLATLEVKARSGHWNTVIFKKEDGAWKIDAVR